MTRPAPTRVLLILALAFAAGTASACWEQAAERYSVNPYLLAAIAKTESGFNPTAVRHNTNNTRDLGVMQINTVLSEPALLQACPFHG